jgi:hypothetical protein
MNINTHTQKKKALGLLIYSQIKTNEKSNHEPSYFIPTYWGADKYLARPTSWCILFDG